MAVIVAVPAHQWCLPAFDRLETPPVDRTKNEERQYKRGTDAADQ